MADIPHVIILGGGFGGIGTLKKLRDADVRITLVDKHNYHTFHQGLRTVESRAPSIIPMGQLSRRARCPFGQFHWTTNVVSSPGPNGKCRSYTHSR